MNNFEFMGHVTIGQYLPSGSVIHHLDARARIIGLGLIFFAAVFTPHIEGLLIGFIVVLALLAAARVPIRFALRGLIPPLPFLLILAVLQVLINPYPEHGMILVKWWIILISMSDILAGVIILIRFAVLILVLSLATFTISTSELIHGLDALFSPIERLGIPMRDFIMMLQITLRFIPFLAQSVERIAKAQAARGADWGSGNGGLINRTRQVIPMIVPLFVTSLRRAENLALAMDARGYGSGPKYSSMIVFHFKPKDAGALLLALAIGSVILFV
jgi:energy-coupling factor transport system permease protein